MSPRGWDRDIHFVPLVPAQRPGGRVVNRQTRGKGTKASPAPASCLPGRPELRALRKRRLRGAVSHPATPSASCAPA